MKTKLLPSLLTNDHSLLPVKQLIQDYLDNDAGINYCTQRAKRFDLTLFYEFLTSLYELPLLFDVTYRDICCFLDECTEQGEKPSTTARRLATIKHFFNIIADRFPGAPNPAKRVKGPRLTPLQPKSLTDEQKYRLIHHARKVADDSFSNFSTYFAIEALLETGMRGGELLSISLKQISLDRKAFLNVRTKGAKIQTKLISDHLRELLEKYLVERETYMRDRAERLNVKYDEEQEDYPLLVNCYGVRSSDPNSWRVSSKTLWRWISNISEEAFGESYSPHRLRHTFAFELLEATKDVRLVCQALGHSNINSTMIYTERTEDKIRNALNSRSRYKWRKAA